MTHDSRTFLRKVEKGENTNVLPVVETDNLDTDLESETGLIDIEENIPVSQNMTGYIPNLPVEGAGVLSDSDPDAAEDPHDRSRHQAPPPTAPDPDTGVDPGTQDWSLERRRSSHPD